MTFRGIKIAALASVALFAATAAASADVIDWTQWTVMTPGSPISAGTASGTMTGVNVSYTGEVDTTSLYGDHGLTPYPSWGPAGTFNGGTVGNAPLATGGLVMLSQGGVLDTITFSTALINPVIAIWSLGNGGDATTFSFSDPFQIESGGPSFEYGGQPLSLLAGGVQGIEGNGTLQFLGSYTSISFTTSSEYWYGFTVGNDLTAGVPEPATWAMFLLGFGAIGWTLRANRKSAAATA